jgi:UDP-2,4-diacetamido-2,4,6-trideoxy-beta-L-altropyranose hydrolase
LLTFRKAVTEDCLLYFRWANDEAVRENALNGQSILLEDHRKWFSKKLNAGDAILLVLEKDAIPIGQVRIDIEKEKRGTLTYSIDKAYRGQGYGKQLLNAAADNFFKEKKGDTLIAIVKKTNIPSIKAFLSAGFDPVEPIDLQHPDLLQFERSE